LLVAHSTHCEGNLPQDWLGWLVEKTGSFDTIYGCKCTQMRAEIDDGL
jgi:hypothetical protein